MESAVGALFGQAVDWVIGHREDDLPKTALTPPVVAKWLFDEATLQSELARNRLRWPTVDFRRRIRNELGDAVDLFNERGWVDEPVKFHRDPPPLDPTDDDVSIRQMKLGRTGFEHLTFVSGYEPWPEEPGRDRWLGYERNATAHAWLLRHPGPPRPWLMCMNGYRTGSPIVDLPAFNAHHLHHRLGLNLAFPVMPLHGPRAAGSSGDRVAYAGAMNIVHTAAQALWDARRLKSWIQEVELAPSVGVMGLSLGGFLSSLLVCFEDDLACAIAGIPESDVVRGMRRNVEPLLPPFYEQWGLSWRSMERATRVVSPLHMDPVVDKDRLFIFAGLVDRWVRPGNVRTLWDHWDRPEICWYQGGHLSFLLQPEVRRFIDEALRSSGMVDPTLRRRTAA